jgi:hypothetical protein
LRIEELARERFKFFIGHPRQGRWIDREQVL